LSVALALNVTTLLRELPAVGALNEVVGAALSTKTGTVEELLLLAAS
jgi:hypothetical protein